MENKKIKLELEKLLIEKQKLEAENSKELIEIKKAFMLRKFEEKFPNSLLLLINDELQYMYTTTEKWFSFFQIECLTMFTRNRY